MPKIWFIDSTVFTLTVCSHSIRHGLHKSLVKSYQGYLHTHTHTHIYIHTGIHTAIYIYYKLAKGTPRSTASFFYDWWLLGLFVICRHLNKVFNNIWFLITGKRVRYWWKGWQHRKKNNKVQLSDHIEWHFNAADWMHDLHAHHKTTGQRFDILITFTLGQFCSLQVSHMHTKSLKSKHFTWYILHKFYISHSRQVGNFFFKFSSSFSSCQLAIITKVCKDIIKGFFPKKFFNILHQNIIHMPLQVSHY